MRRCDITPASIVRCLLDSEGDYTPDGYRLLATAQAGEYQLKLWQGMGHVDGHSIKFNEMSLNREGLSFAPDQQGKKFKGSVHALGYRDDLIKIIESWIKEHGTIYVGSYNPEKLALYHKMLSRYLRRMAISKPYPAFDESEGVPDYFRIELGARTTESLDDEVDAERFVNGLEPKYILTYSSDETGTVFYYGAGGYSAQHRGWDSQLAVATVLTAEEAHKLRDYYLSVSDDYELDVIGFRVELAPPELLKPKQVESLDDEVDAESFVNSLEPKYILTYADESGSAYFCGNVRDVGAIHRWNSQRETATVMSFKRAKRWLSKAERALSDSSGKFSLELAPPDLLNRDRDQQEAVNEEEIDVDKYIDAISSVDDRMRVEAYRMLDDLHRRRELNKGNWMGYADFAVKHVVNKFFDLVKDDSDSASSEAVDALSRLAPYAQMYAKRLTET